MHASAIADRFIRTCRDRGSDVAVRTLWDGRARTFADLRAEFNDVRGALSAAGVHPGSCVVSVAGNRPVFFALFAACMDTGAALLPLNDATDAEIAALVDRTSAAAMVVDRDVHLPANRPGRTVLLGDGIRVIRLHDGQARARYAAPALLKLTSGSTDFPKAAVATEENILSDGHQVIEAMGISPSDVNLAYIPLSHSYAIGNIVMPLIVQGTAVALRQLFHPSQFAADAVACGATVFPGVPFMFEQLQASNEALRLPASLRLLVTAGAPIDIATIAWYAERAGRKVHSFYGSSETGGISYDDGDEVGDSAHVGRPMPDTHVEIRPLDAGESGAGRIFVSGPAVCAGYADASAAERASAFRDGGFLTGDIGRRDAVGRLVLTGRISPLVNVAGRKVDPAEIERVLTGLPEVVEARVLGVSCDRRGEEIVAFVVRSSPAVTPISIRRLCAGQLSPYKIPRRFIFVERLPVDARGKTDRRALEALASTS